MSDIASRGNESYQGGELYEGTGGGEQLATSV